MQRIGLLSLWLVLLGTPNPLFAGTLEDVKTHGYLSCGMYVNVPGFATEARPGTWVGMNADYCRAIATAILGVGANTSIRGVTSANSFSLLSAGDIDVLIGAEPWVLSVTNPSSFFFAGATYYDGQAFLVKSSIGVNSVTQLSGARICARRRSNSGLNLDDFFKLHGLRYSLVALDNISDIKTAYEANQCDAFTSNAAELYALRSLLSAPNTSIVLPEIISKQALGLFVRKDDLTWASIVQWVSYALVAAEELGITKENASSLLRSNDRNIRWLLGSEGNLGSQISLQGNWAYNVLISLGNYGQMFDRNIGSASQLNLARGSNALWTKSGLQFTPPMR